MHPTDALSLFHAMYPGFFHRERIQSLPEDLLFSEMLLPLASFQESAYPRELDPAISFGYYHGSLEVLKETVAQVAPHWCSQFDENARIYCGYVNGQVVSFCRIEHMGTYEIAGQPCQVAGPGCVGTLSAYRNQGIALTMVRRVTQILKEEGYPISYIHFTRVPSWYEKLGYRTFLTWNKNGPVSPTELP